MLVVSSLHKAPPFDRSNDAHSTITHQTSVHVYVLVAIPKGSASQSTMEHMH